ncbi:unnamed protein product [Ilex paraguariensis]|uniref:Uncharacterized protein n=1 Tax=Ilex paraguariensis TaxID=185542 RepID=A0ABC8T3F2_9AQUA
MANGRKKRNHRRRERGGRKGYRLRTAKRHVRRAAKDCSRLHNPCVVLPGHELEAALLRI